MDTVVCLISVCSFKLHIRLKTAKQFQNGGINTKYVQENLKMLKGLSEGYGIENITRSE